MGNIPGLDHGGTHTSNMSKFVIFLGLLIAGIVYSTEMNLCTAAARKEQCPPSAPFFGFMGCAAALVFACLGAAYGTAKLGVGVPGIYGLIVAVLLGSGIDGKKPYNYASYSGYSALAAGLCCGMAGLSAGIAIDIVGDAGVRANARQPKLFVGVILILIFAEALGLYGLIVALIPSANSMTCSDITSNTYYVSGSIEDAATQCTG